MRSLRPNSGLFLIGKNTARIVTFVIGLSERLAHQIRVNCLLQLAAT
jgi:hypothetical protein